MQDYLLLGIKKANWVVRATDQPTTTSASQKPDALWLNSRDPSLNQQVLEHSPKQGHPWYTETVGYIQTPVEDVFILKPTLAPHVSC